MASGTAASVKLYATGLQRPRVLTVKIELMSACGPSRRFGAMRNFVAIGAWLKSSFNSRKHPRALVFRQMITYATSRSVISSALAFSARRFSSKAMVAAMFPLRALRLRANTG
jgi:hypothetical protein